jgi:3-oxoacyl-[acyl-carrier protein] reductase
MDLQLKGRVAVVTGASRGIGLAVADRLAREGADLLLVARGESDLEKASERIRSYGHGLVPVVADVAKNEGVETLTKALEVHYGRLDILVHNAGGTVGRGSFTELTDENWVSTYEVNVLSLVRLVRHLRGYLSDSDQARIVCISSTTAQEPGAYDPHYSSAKAALINLAKHLSTMLSSESILVNTVLPGPVITAAWTSFTEQLGQLAEPGKAHEAITSFESDMRSHIPLGRIGMPEDIADAVAFLASASAGWTTGAVLRIDGGKNRGS